MTSSEIEVDVDWCECCAVSVFVMLGGWVVETVMKVDG